MKKAYIQPAISVVRVEGVSLLDNSPSVNLSTSDVEEGDADEAWSKAHSADLWTDTENE